MGFALLVRACCETSSFFFFYTVIIFFSNIFGESYVYELLGLCVR